METSSYNYSLWKKQAVKLLDVGKKLLRLPSSTDEILLLLEKAESILVMVHQGIPCSKAKALFPLMKALIAEELFRHADLNIRVAVASCLNQITRITAPKYPYEDDQMREIFQLFMVALKQLLTESGITFDRAQVILKSMAQVRSCLMMLDIEVDSMIVEMFQFFLSAIRSNHSDIFKHMETIMILIINESDEISLELLATLLDSVRKNTKETSPISWELGKTIFEKSGPKLQPYLREAAKPLNLKLDDYAEIIASLCAVTANEPIMVTESDKVSDDDQDDSIPKTKDGNGMDNFDDKNSMENSAELVLPVINHASSGDKLMNGIETVQHWKRVRKMNSLMRPEEGYPHIWTRGSQSSSKVSSFLNQASESDRVPEAGQDDGVSQTKGVNGPDDKNSAENSADFSQPIIDNNKVVNGIEIVQSEKRVRKMNSLMRPEEGYAHIWTRGSQGSYTIFSDRNNKEDNLVLPVKPGKGSSLRKSGFGKKVVFDERGWSKKDESSKKIRREVISQKNETGDIADKISESHLSPKTEETFSRSNVEYGEEMVNVRIMVWWPLDKTFYTGTVKAFDPLSKKHKVEYEDGEEEVLNLGEERWELFKERP